MQIEGQTFLVTGGASGLGAAVVESLTWSGANVLIADLDGEAPGENARFVETDVTDEGSVRSSVDAALKLGRLSEVSLPRRRCWGGTAHIR
jgi:NAD(P)-dependent dehydrogenase (short-subunit alcohol dehydrogenase family)